MALLGEAGSYAVGGALCIRQRQVGRVVMGLNLTPRKNRHLFKVINGIEREKTFKIKHVVCFFEKKTSLLGHRVWPEFGFKIFKYVYLYR